MARIAWTARLRTDKVEQYVKAHEEVWPDTLQAIKSAGIRNYSIFLSGTQVFAFYECDDPDYVSHFESTSAAIQLWQAEMADFFEASVGLKGVQVLPEIFRLD